MNNSFQVSPNRLPVTMRAVFQDVLLVTYVVPPELLRAMLPPKVHPFERDRRSFISLVIANIRGMRPSLVPALAGSNYYQIVYRAVVQLQETDGTVRPGVFFLRSDGNDPVMNFFGNRLTEFRFHYFHRGAIGMFKRESDLLVSVESKDGGGDLVLHLTDLGPANTLPAAPGFKNVNDEKQTLVQLFHAYAYDPQRKVVYDLEIERGDWRLQRLGYRDGFTAFFAESPFQMADPNPVSSLYIRECSYVWKPMREIPVERLR